MTFGILKDTKSGEFRVICTPREVRSIVEHGHTVYAMHNCGEAAGFPDKEYTLAGAKIVDTAEKLYELCDMVAKVKEFTISEYPHIRKNQILLGCIHPAANPAQVEALLKSGCIAFTAEDSHRYGSPNCEAAGKLGALFGIQSLLKINGGKGKLISGLVGAPSASALILGAGLVGQSALSVLYSLGARCTVMDINIGALRNLSQIYGDNLNTMLCTKEAIATLLPHTDIVLNCVKWQKERKDFLIDRKMLSLMEKGSVIVDISNDNPGAIETSHETTHQSPSYTVDGIVHYCVPNIPSAAANSTSEAYAASMLPMIMSILDNGIKDTCTINKYYRRSLAVYKGLLTHRETANVQKRPYISPEDALGISD